MKRIVFALLIATNAASADAWIKCEGCTPAQMLDRAQLHVAEGRAVVYDARTPSALKFSNKQEVVGGPNCYQLRPSPGGSGTKQLSRTPQMPAIASGCRIETVSSSLALTLNDQNVLNALHSIHAQTNGRMKSRIDLNAQDMNLGPGPVTTPPGDPGFGPSAADYANNVGFRATVDAYAARFTQHSPSILTAAVNTYTYITQPWNVITTGVGVWLGEDATITVVVTFDDGSLVELDFEFETPNTAVVKAMKDAEGRDIMTPANYEDFSNTTIRFPNGGVAAMENFVRNAEYLRIPVAGMDAPVISGGCRRIVDGIACLRVIRTN